MVSSFRPTDPDTSPRCLPISRPAAFRDRPAVGGVVTRLAFSPSPPPPPARAHAPRRTSVHHRRRMMGMGDGGGGRRYGRRSRLRLSARAAARGWIGGGRVGGGGGGDRRRRTRRVVVASGREGEERNCMRDSLSPRHGGRGWATHERVRLAGLRRRCGGTERGRRRWRTGRRTALTNNETMYHRR